MARATYEHIEAPGRVILGGSIAFEKGDPIPVDTARRYQIEGEVQQPSDEPAGDGAFADVALIITDEGTEVHRARTDEAPAPDADAASATTPPAGANPAASANPPNPSGPRPQTTPEGA